MSFKKLSLLVFLLILAFGGLKAQEKERLSTIWKDAELKGQLRNYWMLTANQDSLQDFRAGAVGGKLLLESGKFKGFSFGLGGYTSLNLGLQPLDQSDLTTKKGSRYEIGLFDITDPSRDFILLLGEAYIRWQQKSHRLSLGRMRFNSPMLNPQDGRMIPTLVQGIWYGYETPKPLNFGLGFFNAISPRSTSRWYRTEDALGQYPQGISVYGPGNYLNNLSSPGLAVGSLDWKPSEKLQLQLWDYAFLNVMNSLYTELQWTSSYSETSKLKLGLQYILQHPLADGGNADPSKAYYPADQRTHIGGIRAELGGQKLRSSLAYTRIFAGGQFLFPREWGRDALFTFQKRERQEGLADTHAFLWQTTYKYSKSWQLIAGAGYYNLPDVKNTAENKYAQPTYAQLNIDLFYQPAFLPQLQSEFLIAYKLGVGETYSNANFVLNKVDMAVFQLVLNYNFTLARERASTK